MPAHLALYPSQLNQVPFTVLSEGFSEMNERTTHVSCQHKLIMTATALSRRFMACIAILRAVRVSLTVIVCVVVLQVQSLESPLLRDVCMY
jgi:hypothetical protein